MSAMACLQHVHALRRLQNVKHALFLGILLLFSAVQSAFGCEAMPLTLRRVSGDITVLVTHRDKPIAGISVSVVPEKQTLAVFLGDTDRHGIVVIRGLPVGQYFVTAVHYNLEAGKELIRVVAAPDAKTVNRLKFEWADWSYETNRVAGTLTGLIPGNTGSQLMNILHPVKTFYPGVDMTLKNAFSEEEFHTTSDSSGGFMFGDVPDGIYVLTIAGGMKSVTGIAGSTIQVIDVKRISKRDSLPLELKDTGCYGAEFELSEN
jgi:hypothetical protein